MNLTDFLQAKDNNFYKHICVTVFLYHDALNTVYVLSWSRKQWEAIKEIRSVKISNHYLKKKKQRAQIVYAKYFPSG